MGIETVAVFSEGDRGSSYLDLADQAFCVGSAKSSDSYLKVDRIISAAEVSGADAIHPGYGFLSENSRFNEICRDCEIEFIGPTPDAMDKLGDKNQARELAKAANVPVVPGSDGIIDDDNEAIRVAAEIGYPVLIKATAGGGGKGMRVAESEDELITGLQQARTEAGAAFGNPAVYLEKYIGQPRHVEVQILADQHGNVVHLWDRDCTTQRRHQKLVEESPSPSISQEVRTSICEAAVRMIKHANYHNAGTVEFIVDQNNEFFFIEVNARIQVEHPVTELVTGIDLIKSQIQIAAGEKLPFTQADIPLIGCAIECRINAEDASHDFRPCPGLIEEMFVPGGMGVRFDSHAHAGYRVPPYYDSMIGKLLVHQPTREQAIAKMLRALSELRIKGIKTTVDFHEAILRQPEFQNATIDTKFVERTMSDWFKPE